MIDLNDAQLNKHGQLVYLLTNKTFKDEIEQEKDDQGYGCPGLKDAKYIYKLSFHLNINYLYDKA